MFCRTILPGVCIVLVLVICLESVEARDYKRRVKRGLWGSGDDSNDHLDALNDVIEDSNDGSGLWGSDYHWNDEVKVSNDGVQESNDDIQALNDDIEDSSDGVGWRDFENDSNYVVENSESNDDAKDLNDDVLDSNDEAGRWDSEDDSNDDVEHVNDDVKDSNDGGAWWGSEHDSNDNVKDVNSEIGDIGLIEGSTDNEIEHIELVEGSADHGVEDVIDILPNIDDDDDLHDFIKDLNDVEDDLNGDVDNSNDDKKDSSEYVEDSQGNTQGLNNNVHDSNITNDAGWFGSEDNSKVDVEDFNDYVRDFNGDIEDSNNDVEDDSNYDKVDSKDEIEEMAESMGENSTDNRVDNATDIKSTNDLVENYSNGDEKNIDIQDYSNDVGWFGSEDNSKDDVDDFNDDVGNFNGDIQDSNDDVEDDSNDNKLDSKDEIEEMAESMGENSTDNRVDNATDIKSTNDLVENDSNGDEKGTNNTIEDSNAGIRDANDDVENYLNNGIIDNSKNIVEDSIDIIEVSNDKIEEVAEEIAESSNETASDNVKDSNDDKEDHSIDFVEDSIDIIQVANDKIEDVAKEISLSSNENINDNVKDSNDDIEDNSRDIVEDAIDIKEGANDKIEDVAKEIAESSNDGEVEDVIDIGSNKDYSVDEDDSLSMCDQPMETGMCRGYFPSWYFNKEAGNCEEFVYGGCDSNQNKFASKELCEEGCVNKGPIDTEYYTDDYNAEDYANYNYTHTPPATDGMDDIVEISVDYLFESDAVSQHPCNGYEHGCCDNSQLPSHGPMGEGCCLSSQFGCCPDNLRPAASGPDMAGCECEASKFGCCPDQRTTMRSEDGEGCGCKHSQYGCCEDHYTQAVGPDNEGCPCHTFDFGCCPDGKTVAQGPNGEGCSGCQGFEFGCCSDGFTPSKGERDGGCDCSSSRYGCCTGGDSEAEGENFEGCAGKPGEMCRLKLDKGSCTKLGRVPQFTVRWYYNMKEGRCTRFWFEGCEGNANNFEDEHTCNFNCVDPPGSGKCYLPSVKGYCSANEEKWYFDARFERCVPFEYSGCLGNANRFESQQECQQSCVRTDTLAICEQPLEAGPCHGYFSRWHYDETSGQCKEFVYGGCHGNRNRFVTKQECENSCKHDSIAKLATLHCKQPIEEGSCNHTLARWAFDQEKRQCKPFYFSGCDQNTNNFESLEECERNCPNSFAPEVQVINKVINVEEGQSALLEITVKGNPFPEISWQHNHEVVSWNERISMRDDHSVVIKKAVNGDAGTWTVYATGSRKLVRKQVSLSVYPSKIPLKAEILLDETNFPSGSEIQIVCSVDGFPIPRIKWMKNYAGLPISSRITVENGDTLIINRASPVDGGTYTCKAFNQYEYSLDSVQITVEQGEVPEQCTDRPKLANCALVVQGQKYCNMPGFAKICCRSCVESGQIAGPVV